MEMSTWSLGMLQELGLERVITSKKPQNSSKPQNKLKNIQSKPNWRECLKKTGNLKHVCALGQDWVLQASINYSFYWIHTNPAGKPNPV